MNRKKALSLAIELLDREIKRLALPARQYAQFPEFWAVKRGSYRRHAELQAARDVLQAEISETSGGWNAA